MNKVSPVEMHVNGVVPVLSISPSEEDHELLDQILNGSESNWDVVKTDTVLSAMSLLRERWFPIVICERDLAGGSWEYILGQPRERARAWVIVTSRFADERLWAEALNLGAYDVLAKPFDRHEVYRVVDSAWQHWVNSGVRNSSTAPRAVTARQADVAAAIRAFALPPDARVDSHRSGCA